MAKGPVREQTVLLLDSLCGKTTEEFSFTFLNQQLNSGRMSMQLHGRMGELKEKSNTSWDWGLSALLFHILL